MMKQGIRKQKNDLARSYLYSKVITAMPGCAVASLRTMQHESGLGRNILQNALEEAEDAGLLIHQANARFFRAPVNDSIPVDLAIFAENTDGQLDGVGTDRIPSHAAREVLRLISLARESGLRVRVCSSAAELPDMKIPVFSVCPNRPEIVEELEKRYPRVVVCSRNYGKLYVKTPLALATKRGLQFLWELGHCRIGFLHYEGRGINPHLFEYYKFMAEHSGGVQREYTVPYTDEETVLAGLEKMFSSKLAPTAVFTATCWLPTVYRFCSSHDLDIPGKVSILGCGTMDFLEKLTPTPSQIRESPESEAEAAWDLMYRSGKEAGNGTYELQILRTPSVRRR